MTNPPFSSTHTSRFFRKTLLFAAFVGLATTALAQTYRTGYQYSLDASLATATSSIPVSGKANPWLADATTAASGDIAPDESPVIVSLVDFNPGDELVFTATGGASYSGGTPSATPDGDLAGFRSLYHLNAANGGPENNIGGLGAPANSLVGVFLGPDPSTSAPSTFFDFAPDPNGNVTGSIDYTVLAPELAQPFFIGDGVTSSNVQQHVTVPTGATRLVLGSMDGSGWFNNSGSFSVTIALAGAPGDSDVSATLSAPISITVGSNLTYQFHIHNNGPSTATGVKVSFQPSSKESFVSATVPYTVQIGGPADGYYFINLPDLTSGATNNFSFVFKANITGQITLAGGSSTTSNDPNGANNGFVANTNATVAPPPTAPAHGGLSATTFTVNESNSASAGVADTVLRFAAQQTGTPAGLVVRVQTSSTPATESSWTDLPNGNLGQMGYDASSKKFLLSSLNYPLVNGLYFRAIASGSGYPDSISNHVGPFNLFSNKPRLTPPILAVTGNGFFADLYFRAQVGTATGGMAIRVQTSTTPFNENSWTDLNDGHAGHMQQSNDAKRFFLLANNVPPGSGIYFRALASRSGYADGLSRPNGPYKITTDKPPTITSFKITPNGLAGSGNGKDFAHPIIFKPGQFTLSASVAPSSGRSIKAIKLLYDGNTLFRSNGTATTLQYTTSIAGVGDHVFEVVAVDDLGATSRAGTNPLFVRIIPNTSASQAEHAPGASSTAAATISGKVYTVVQSGGNWDNAATWKDAQGKNGVPGRNDLAIVGTSTVKCPLDVVVGSVTLSGGRIIGPGTLDIYGTITISAGTFQNAALYIASSGVCELINSVNIQFSGTVINFGAWNVHGSGGLLGMDVFDNHGTTNFQAPLTIPLNAGLDPALDTRKIAALSVPNSGLISSTISSLITNDGGSLITNDGGSLITNDGGSLITNDGGSIVAQGGGNIVAQGGGNIVAQGGGNIVAQGGGNMLASENGFAMTAAAPTPSGFVQNGGETDLTGITITGPVTLNGGVLSGTGMILGSLTNNSGYIMPGHSPGAIGITGNFKQGANGTIILEESGKTPDKFDQLEVGGSAALGGNLELHPINGYKPNVADTFTPLGFKSVTGSFAKVSSNTNVSIKATGLLTSVNGTMASPAVSRAANISTRAKVQTGDGVTIAGFIVSGPAGSTKKVIVRGLGPSLASAGVVGALADPYIELRHGATLLAANDNWRQRQSEVQASGLPPTKDLESAIVATLAPGAYTVTLRGAHNEIGVGLIEVYDLAPASTASLANISTRCQVLAGDQVMIGGFILKGGSPPRIIVRAIGPSLAAAGVSGALADPVLELHDSNGATITNDNWRATQESEIIATELQPTDNREAAIIATLPPGAYTAIVRGANGTTGVALVEAYNLQ